MPSFEEIKARLDQFPPHSPPDRERFLNETCGSDASLMSLAGALFDERFASGFENTGQLDRTVGPYKLERELGHGGMGVVYLASRNDALYHKKVAIKLLQPGHGGDEVLRRFQNERQILANLDHPNICRLFDGGISHEEEPYFVMEYVREALPIDEYCDMHKLPLRARLDLFRQACAAVQYAHRFLIVHRDLKPSNILVSGEGDAKLMDFGIAKNLLEPFGPGPALKTIGMAPMTPAYASPEQVRGQGISTSSDVYSLGVVLYQLLTGQHPFQRKDQPLPDLLQSICETEPARPSTVLGPVEQQTSIRGKHLKGDLDWIVLMALRKDAARRYGSVEQMSEDIRRHLQGHPIKARSDTLGYLTTKFVNRNKVGVGAVALVILTLIGGIVSTRMEQLRTRDRFNDVRQLANSLLFEINDAIRDLPGSTPARMLLVKSSLTYLDKLAKEAGDDLSLQRELAEAYRRISLIQYAVGGANIGDIAGALVSARKEMAIRDWISARDNTISSRLAVAEAHHRLCDLLEGTGDPAGSSSHLDQAMAILQLLHAQDKKDPRIRAELAGTYRVLGDKEKMRNHSAAAIGMNRKALAIREGLLAENPKDQVTRRQLSQDLVRIGDSLGSSSEANLGRYEEARENYEKALSIRRALQAENPASATYARDVCNVTQRLGSMLIAMGGYDESLAYSRSTLGILDRMWAADPANSEVRRDIAVVHNQIGRALEKLHDMAGAEQHMREGIAVELELVRRNPKSDRSQDDLAGSRMSLGAVLVRANRGSEALTPLLQAREALRLLLARDPEVGRYQTKMMRIQGLIASIHARQGDRKTACAEYKEAADLGVRLARENRLGAVDKDEPAKELKAMQACVK